MTSLNDNWRLIESIYEHASNLPVGEREAYVKNKTENNLALFNQLINMLKVDENDEFMSSIPKEITTDALNKQLEFNRIGHFEIIEKIASGGMGVVYKAQSALSDVKITVALKTIRTELKNSEMESRFYNEKTILAKLKHKNIATLVDAGVADNGIPYIATEWIDGNNIMQYCDDHQLGLKDRLNLFTQLCGAVSHAHNQFIIHRDIKPANIMIDKNNQVNLLDFGIAKLTEDEQASETQTQIFTPDYAAPEQINGLKCSVVTDVYALGILLFELLTAQKRFNLDLLPISEKIKQICHPTVINASDKIKDKQHPIRVSALKGMLNTIINKAMHVDESRRYQSVALLMDDINRYLTNRPIKAIKDSWYYRSSMFVKRHLWSSILGLMVFISLISGMLMSMQQAKIAQIEANKSKQLHDFYKTSLRAASPNNGGSTNISVRDMFVNGAENFNFDNIDDPLIRAEIAAEIGQVFAELEEYENSEKYTQLAIDFYANDLQKYASEYLKNSSDLATYYNLKQDHVLALNTIESALDRTSKFDIEPIVVTKTLINIGVFNNELDNTELALKAYDDAETIAIKNQDLESLGKINYYKFILLREKQSNKYLNDLLFKAQSNFEQVYEKDNHPDLIALRNSLAILLTAQGDYEAADQVFQKLIKQVQLNTNKINYENYINRANVKYYMGDFKAAVELTTKALDRIKELKLKPGFTEMAARIIQARALTELAQFEKSDRLFQQAFNFLIQNFDEEHKVIKTLNAYRADLYLKSNQLFKAQKLVKGMDKYAQDQLTEAHANQNRYVNIMMTLACLESQLENHDLALQYFQEANEILQSNTKQQGWIYWVIQAGIEKSKYKLKNTGSIEKYNAATNQLFAILNNHNWYDQFFNLNNDAKIL